MPLLPEIQQIADGIDRPMRYAKTLEPVAVRSITNTSQAHREFFAEILDILPTPSFRSLRAAENKKYDTLLYVLDIQHYYDCDCCGDPIVKEFNDTEIDIIDQEFFNQLKQQVGGREARRIIRDMDKAGQDFVDKMVGKSPGIDPGKRRIMDWAYFETIKRTMAAATRKVRRAWQKMGKLWRRQNPFTPGPEVFGPGTAFVDEIYRTGFRLVTSKITKFFLPEMKRIIIDELRKGKAWNSIASTMNKRAGMGGLWHWKRLIRSEMAMSINKASLHRYRELGITWVKYSAAHGRCPICGAWAKKNEGFYPIGQFPNITEMTHPNCRCHSNPVFNVPKRIRERYESNPGLFVT